MQTLEQQYTEIEALGTRIKAQRKIPKPIKKAYSDQSWWQSSAIDQTKEYQMYIDDYHKWLVTYVQEQHRERLSTFEKLQEDVDILYPE